MEKDEATAAVSEGVKAAVLGGVLVQLKQSFFVKGVTFAKPADITLGVEELHPPKDASSRPAAAGDVVDVAYVGKLSENDHVFETSTLVFVLGEGNVIKAWDEGVLGMREGQQRRLTCPPKLAYGKRGSPPEIGPDATLVFDITFRSFRTAAEVEGDEEEEEVDEFDEEVDDESEGLSHVATASLPAMLA